MGKKSAFLGQKQCFLGKKCTITWYILYIILNEICKFAIKHKNDAFVAKIAKTFVAIFTLAKRLPTSAILKGVRGKLSQDDVQRLHVQPDPDLCSLCEFKISDPHPQEGRHCELVMWM